MSFSSFVFILQCFQGPSVFIVGFKLCPAFSFVDEVCSHTVSLSSSSTSYSTWDYFQGSYLFQSQIQALLEHFPAPVGSLFQSVQTGGNLHIYTNTYTCTQNYYFPSSHKIRCYFCHSPER